MTPAEFQTRTGASVAAMTDLERYREMLVAGNEVMNLVGPASLPDYWNRHAFDSAQLLSLAPEASTWADLGAGAGLPGIVLAILSQAKRIRFLNEVVSTLSLPTQVIHARAEALALQVDIVTARACAPLDRLLQFAAPYRKRGAEALFLKGEKAEEEIAAARRSHRFDVEVLPSASDPRGRILRIRSSQRVV